MIELDRLSKFGCNLQWGNSFLAKRAARGLVKIGIVVAVTDGDMDVAIEPQGCFF